MTNMAMVRMVMMMLRTATSCVRATNLDSAYVNNRRSCVESSGIPGSGSNRMKVLRNEPAHVYKLSLQSKRLVRMQGKDAKPLRG